MNVDVIKSFAKINLALYITGKLATLHKIESIVAFIHLHDLITIKKISGKNHQISFYGNFSRNITRNNTVKKLFNILDTYNLLKDQKFQIKIKKNIPQKAGLGGGSMNAAYILNYLIKKKVIKINQKKISRIANLIGTDVILGVDPKSSILTSNNLVRKFSKIRSFYILLVRPKFGCSTKKIYSGVQKFTKPVLSAPKKNMFNLKFLLKQENALEKIVFLKYPKLRKIKNFLENLRKPLFVRMTGSGSVLVVYYQKKQDCELAKVQFKRKYKNYWCNVSKTL